MTHIPTMVARRPRLRGPQGGHNGSIRGALRPSFMGPIPQLYHQSPEGFISERSGLVLILDILLNGLVLD